MILKAAAMSALKVPFTNSSWMGDFIRIYKHVNMGVAVQTNDGYAIPVIRNIDTKGLDLIAKEAKDLATRAKEGKLSTEET